MGRGALSVGAEHADGVRVVDGEGGAVFLTDLQQTGDVGDVAFHRIDAVHDHHAAGALGQLLQLALEPGEIAVVEAHRIAVRHFRAVDDRGVVELVEEDDVGAAHQA